MIDRLQVAHDTYVLLGLGIIVLAFISYELAGLTLPGWHTISFYAKQHTWLFAAILIGFMALGMVAPMWWTYHVRFGNITR